MAAAAIAFISFRQYARIVDANCFSSLLSRGKLARKEEELGASLCLVAPPQAAAGYGTNSGFCRRTTFEDICAVRKLKDVFRSSQNWS